MANFAASKGKGERFSQKHRIVVPIGSLYCLDRSKGKIGIAGGNAARITNLYLCI